MSGTSVDGVDGVLARLAHGQPPQVLASASLDMPSALRAELLALNQSGADELARAALAANALARLYADTAARLLDASGVAPRDVIAIGAHGQTVRHRPDSGYTVQLNAPALLAELSGIDVVADFRSRDVAAGGQGAPLVPPFHAAIFGAPQARGAEPGRHRQRHAAYARRAGARLRHRPRQCAAGRMVPAPPEPALDADGRWAASGKVLAPLLEALIAGEPWFALPPPSPPGEISSTCAGWTTGWRPATARARRLRTCRPHCSA